VGKSIIVGDKTDILQLETTGVGGPRLQSKKEILEIKNVFE